MLTLHVDGVQYVITLKGGKVLDTPQSTKITMECDANGDKNVRSWSGDETV